MNTNRSFVAGLAVLALGLAGLIGGGAATVHAAGTAVSALELTLEAELTPPFFMTAEGGTFRSRAPFCASGRFVEDGDWYSATWRFTCDDGTGGLTVVLLPDATWRILGGSSSYADLRGKGSLREGQLLCGTNCDFGRPIPWGAILEGVVDRDTVAPTIAFSSATATKLPRPKGAYAVRLGIALRDDVIGNPVSYTVRACLYTVDACAGTLELARRFGTARTEAVSVTLHIRPPARGRTVQLQLTAEDPVGNAISVRHSLRLP